MLTAERRQYILSILHRDGKIVAKDLSEELNLSEDTIRRDLRDLAGDGLLLRVHGGALPYSPATANFASRQEQAAAAKISIARVAARLVRPGQVIILDAGTTTLQVAQNLPMDLHATVITNNPPIAAALSDHSGLEVILLGGRLLKSSLATIGTTTIEELRRIRADLCFLGICSLHPEVGISTNYLEEADLKRAMIECSAETIALASPEKLNTAAPYLVGPLTELTEIITESSVSDEILQPYRDLGITITPA
jgi:DeoR/GlpR family transcriptional regulator of sugar metabolism